MSESTTGGFRRAVLVSEPKQAEPRSFCCQRNTDVFLYQYEELKRQRLGFAQEDKNIPYSDFWLNTLS